MDKKKRSIYAALIGVGFVLYLALLIYICSIQSDYDVRLKTNQELYTVQASEISNFTIPVKIQNRANRPLWCTNDNIYLSYHLYDAEGNLLGYDQIRTPIDKNLYPGDKTTVELQVSPLEAGTYQLGLDIVQEGVVWFSDMEEIEKKITLVVE